MKRILKALRHPEMISRWFRQRFIVSFVIPLPIRQLLGSVLPPYRSSRFRSVYLVTYGRSGSTLLAGYLSMLPGFDLRGENYLYMMPMAQSDERMAQLAALKYAGRHKTSSPWYGSQQASYPRFRRQIKRMVLNQLYPKSPIPKTLGFKEIRWWYRLTPTRFEQDLDWLTGLFPKGAIVVLTRDLEKVFAGAWWAEMSEVERAEAEPKLREFEKLALEYVASHPDHAFHVTYEGFTSDESVARALTEFLGVSFKANRWRKALGTRFSYPSKPDEKTETKSL